MNDKGEKSAQWKVMYKTGLTMKSRLPMGLRFQQKCIMKQDKGRKLRERGRLQYKCRPWKLSLQQREVKLQRG